MVELSVVRETQNNEELKGVTCISPVALPFRFSSNEIYCQRNFHIQSVQLKSGSYLNISNLFIKIYNILFIHSFSILSDDRSKASSKTKPPYSAIQRLLLQIRISSPVLKVIQ